MEILVKNLNKFNNNKFQNVKLANATYFKSRNVLELKFIYKNDEDINSEQLKENLLSACKSYLNSDVKIVVKCKKSFLEKDVVKEFLKDYFAENYKNLSFNIKNNTIDVEILDDVVNCKITAIKVFYDYMNDSLIISKIREELENNFFATFNVEIFEENNTSNCLEKSLNRQEEKVKEMMLNDDVEPQQKFEVSNVTTFVGKEIVGSPIMLADIKEPGESYVVAGKIKYFTKHTFEKKKKVNNQEEVVEKEFYKFVLDDTTCEMQAVYFPTKNDLEKIPELQDGKTVLVGGDVEQFADKLNIKVKSISFCTMPEKVERKEKTINNIVFSTYLNVKPEPYVDIKQVNLFDKSEEVCDLLKNNTFVVFDLETTGLDASFCEIIEIGAVKVVNGVITEKFLTFVKPSVPIPPEITNLTGITDDMVADGLTLEQMIPDFYKFAENCILVAHNIDFDYKFLYKAGLSCGYSFKNKRIDTYALARAFVRGVKKYKLGVLVDYFNLTLDNAHRAVFDAIACAEVFLKLADKVTDDFIMKD